MPVRLVFLGKLADLAGGGERELDAATGWGALLTTLEPELAAEVACERVRVAVNGTLVADKRTLSLADGDELAFLPPVSGG